MRWLVNGIILMVFSVTSALAATAAPFNHMVVLGDSLSDPGNLLHHDFGLLPKSPPYYKGRFSNGLNWADDLAADFHDMGVSEENYAVGGAKTGSSKDFYGIEFPATAISELYEYEMIHQKDNKEKTLFIIWIGANDYLYGSDDVAGTTSYVMNGVAFILDKLIADGAKNILLINLPDIGEVPYALHSAPAIKQNFSDLSLTHDKKLKQLIADYVTRNPAIAIKEFDVLPVFEMLLHHTASVNKQYGLHITDVTDACWGGGYYANAIRKPPAMSTTMPFRAEENLARLSSDATLRKMDGSQFMTAVAQSPVLMEAYNVGQAKAAGVTPCVNPDQYIFWDKMHPTRVVHRILSDKIETFILKNY